MTNNNRFIIVQRRETRLKQQVCGVYMIDSIGELPSPLVRYLEEATGIGLWRWEVEENKLYWSLGMFRLLGLDPGVHTPSFELYQSLVHPEDQLDFSQAQSIIRSGRLDRRLVRIRQPGGTQRWLESHGRQIFDDQHTLRQMVGFALDVTATRGAIAASEKYLSVLEMTQAFAGGTVCEISPDGLTMTEVDWRRAWGDADQPGASWRERLDAFHEDDRENMDRNWRSAVEAQRPFEAIARSNSRNRGYELLEVLARPIKSERSLIGWVGMCRPAMLPRGWQEASPADVPASLLRAGRAYLGHSSHDLAALVGLSYSTIRRLEGMATGAVGAQPKTVLVKFFSDNGIVFLLDPRKMPQMITTGTDGPP